MLRRRITTLALTAVTALTAVAAAGVPGAHAATTNGADAVLIVDDSDNLATPVGHDGDTTVTIIDPFAFRPGASKEPTEGDRASCGADADTVVSDRRTLDAVDADCETVDALPEPDGQPTQPDGQPTQPDVQPTQPETPDTTLSLSLSGASRQRVVRQRAVHVKVSCPLEPCTAVASASGRLQAVAASRLRATTLRLRPVTASIAGATSRTLKLRLARRQRIALRKALAAGQRPRIKVSVRARDATGNTVRRTLRVTARR